jgi:hypothetical protein
MEAFLELMRPSRGAKILDVGGLPELNGVPGMWNHLNSVFEVTLLNLPGTFSRYESRLTRPYRLIEADACGSSEARHGFDIVFSNSVIEHVGGDEKQKQFAEFVMTAGRRYWVQTPSPFFPLEAHCDLPFWWCYPNRTRIFLQERWRLAGNEFLAKQMETTLPISKGILRRLFPGCSIYTEKLAGFSKSFIAYGDSAEMERPPREAI